MKPEDIYWDKPDLPDDLRAMGDNLFPGLANALRRALLHSAAKRIETLEAQSADTETDLNQDNFYGNFFSIRRTTKLPPINALL
jgi:hypothetical protein